MAATRTLTTSATSLAFGREGVTTAVTKTVTLSSTGNLPLTINAPTISGAGLAFTGTTFPVTLNPGQTTVLTLTFDPAVAGAVTGALTIPSNDNSSAGTSTAISLTGTGVPEVTAITCASASVIGSTTDVCTVIVNVSAATGGTSVFLGSNNTAVTVPATVPVAAGATTASFTAKVNWTSLTAGAATLTASDGAISKTAVLQLLASTRTLTTSASTLAFGNVGAISTQTRTLTLSSTGNLPLTINAPTISGAGFAFTGTTFPVTLNPGQTTVLTLTFDPAVAGAVTGALTISSNNNSSAGTSTAISLTGTGIPKMTGVTCANLSVTGSTTDVCTVTVNVAAATGGSAVTLESNNTAVTVPATVTVAAGATTANFTATVNSTSLTASTATLTGIDGGIGRSVALQLLAATRTLTTSATTLAFGSDGVTTAVTNTLTLSSTGNLPLTINAPTITGAGFTVTGTTFPVTLNPGQTTALTVRFDPTAAGAVTGALTISSNNNSSAGTSTAITLTGTGIPKMTGVTCANLSVTGSTTDVCTVTVSVAAATGGSTVTLASNSTAVTVPATVSVAAGAASASFTATVNWSSLTAGTATLTASDGGISKTVALQLLAATRTLTTSATTVAFGNVVLNTPTTQSLTLGSAGSLSVTINAPTITGTGFTVSGTTFPLTLNPGQTTVLSVKFDPTAAGAVAGTLTITSNNNSSSGTTAAISLTGTGTAAPAPALSGLTCASGSITGAATDACSVALSAPAPSGGLSVSLSASNSAVTVPATVTVAAGATSASFTATVAAVTTSQAVTLKASAGSVLESLALQLYAGVPTLSVSATNVSFGNVTVNSAATAQSVTLTSTGTGAVTVSAATLTGTGFSISGVTFPLTLSPGQAATLTVGFKPTSAAAATGQLTLTSNSSTSTTNSIALSGTGVTVAYSVSLSWAAPASSAVPIVGYKVFRAINGSSSYTVLNSTVDTQTAYVDSTVAAGSAYAYIVESVDSSGALSAPSNMFSVTIP